MKMRLEISFTLKALLPKTRQWLLSFLRCPLTSFTNYTNNVGLEYRFRKNYCCLQVKKRMPFLTNKFCAPPRHLSNID